MEHVHEVPNSGSESHRHCGFVYHLARAVADHRDAENLFRLVIGDHFDQAAGVADCPGARHERHRNRGAPAFLSGGFDLFLRHSHRGDLRIGEDRAGDDPMIDPSQLSDNEGIVGGDTAGRLPKLRGIMPEDGGMSLRRFGRRRGYCRSSAILARFNKSEFPTTVSELRVMATTPTIGCRRPTAAIGIATTL